MKCLQHALNEVHVYCRLRDLHVPCDKARMCAAAFGHATRVVVYPSFFLARHWVFLWALVWIMVLISLSACYPVHFVVPEMPVSESPLGPDHFDSGNLIERWRPER